jgi:hypothetical protein
MIRLRINHAPLFVTLLSASLGLMAAGASWQARQTATSVLSEIAAVTSAQCVYGHASSQTLKLPAAYSSKPLAFASRSQSKSPEVGSTNSIPFTPGNRILVVTRLARASLDAPAPCEAGEAI